MDPEHWGRIRAAFDELVELEPGPRAERLAALDRENPGLRRAVEALLESDAGAEAHLAGMLFGSADPLGLSGRTISHFRVLQPLGTGGMGVVYSAEDTRLNRSVALKFPLPEHRLDSSAKQRFLQEARSAGALDHPNVCNIYEVGETEDGLLFMAMRLYPGETLKARLAREGALPVQQAVEIARQIAEGLAAAHQSGIVHRDLKPGNVMILPDDTVKILDFGLAKVRDLSLTGPRMLLGTAAYMAPEQIRGDSVDGRADLWALGVVLYEMLTGRQPFRGEHEVSIGHAIVHREPSRPSDLRTEIPSPVEGLVLTLLAKDPAMRHATAGEAASDLSAIRRGEPHADRRAASRRTAMRRNGARAAAALLLIGGAVVAYLAIRPEAAQFEPNLLAVAPFDVSDPSLQLWREGLVDILSLDLDGAGPLRTVPQTVVLRRWSGRADRASAMQLGSRTGAELVVFGHVVRRGADSVGLRAAVLDRSSGTTMRDFEVLGEEGRMGELADSLGIEILRALGRVRAIGAMRQATIGARSLAALKAFLRGEQFYRGGHWDSALAHYDQAIAQDPNFVLALRRMVRVIDWAPATVGSYRPAREYLGRAVVLNRGLAPRDSLLLLADSLRLVTDSLLGLGADSLRRAADPGALLRSGHGMIEVLEEAARRYPGDPDIWFELGEARYHWAPMIGVSAKRALEALDRAIALDSGFSPSYEHTVELALQFRRPDQAAEYVRIGGALASDYQASDLRLAGLVLDSGSSVQTVDRALSGASTGSLIRIGREHLRWATDSGEAAIEVLRRLLEGRHDQPGGMRRVLRRRFVASALAFRGHLRAAAEIGIEPPPKGLGRTEARSEPFLDLALFGAVPDSVAHRVFSEALAPEANWSWPPDVSPPRHLRGAPWWLARRDTSTLHRFASRAARAGREPGPPVAVLRGRYLYAAAIAYVVLARGDSLRATQLLQAIPDSLCLVTLCFHEKVTLARLLAARGADAEAAALLDRWGATDGSMPSAVLAALDRARIAERLSDTATARDRYQFVAEAWRNADPELQKHVAEARASGERLKRPR